MFRREQLTAIFELLDNINRNKLQDILSLHEQKETDEVISLLGEVYEICGIAIISPEFPAEYESNYGYPPREVFK
jgi:hypothetical protein